MRSNKPDYNPALGATTVQCPSCGAGFQSSEAGTFQYHRCQVCHHAWKEIFLREVQEPGNRVFMDRAHNEHRNLDRGHHFIIFTLRAFLGNLQRILKPIRCATPGCQGRLEHIEHLVAQLLVGGWPSTGGKPILCPACAKGRGQGGSVEKTNP